MKKILKNTYKHYEHLQLFPKPKPLFKISDLLLSMYQEYGGFSFFSFFFLWSKHILILELLFLGCLIRFFLWSPIVYLHIPLIPMFFVLPGLDHGKYDIIIHGTILYGCFLCLLGMFMLMNVTISKYLSLLDGYASDPCLVEQYLNLLSYLARRALIWALMIFISSLALDVIQDRMNIEAILTIEGCTGERIPDEVLLEIIKRKIK